MKKKPPKATPPKPTRKVLSAGAAIAAGVPLALSILPEAFKTAKDMTGTTPPTVAAKSFPGAPFSSRCALPFGKLKTAGLNIDAVCGIEGRATDEEERLEFRAKNNFCATGDPTPITYEDLVDLQKGADSVPGLRDRLDSSRKELLGNLSAGKPKLGEGTLVQLVAFLKDARNSNPGKGEKVNCNLGSKEENDIHIELMNDSNEIEPCKSVTAEMSPHFRPKEWQAIVRMKEFPRPVRVTGPLFFDNSHQPCRGDKHPNPKRISVWEIHPVYQLDICNVKTTDLKACDVTKDSQWTPLDQWGSADDDDEP